MSSETAGPDAPNFIRAPFVDRIQRELSTPENRAKNAEIGGWAGWQPDEWQLMHEIRTHVTKLAVALRANDRDGVSHHAADIAAYTMKASEIHGID